jgi:cell wall-associated NlpC family hydrolase
MKGGYSAKHSPLGLGPGQRVAIRSKAMDACMVMYHHAGIMQYSEGADRWSGIAQHKRAYLGEYPPAADCSSSITWALWDSTRAEKLGDFVNGANWNSGFTGTQTQHGSRIHQNELIRADLVFYGNQGGGVPKHVAMYIGNGRVFSHGSSGGPRILKIDYRKDINQFRRYIR